MFSISYLLSTLQTSASIQPRTSLSKFGGDSVHFFIRLLSAPLGPGARAREGVRHPARAPAFRAEPEPPRLERDPAVRPIAILKEHLEIVLVFARLFGHVDFFIMWSFEFHLVAVSFLNILEY